MITSKWLKWAIPAGALALLLALAAACGGGDSNKGASPGASGSANDAAQQLIMGHPAPPPNLADIPATYDPKPGDLLFYTNGSISYNSQAKHPWVVIIDAKTKKIVAGSEIPEVDSSPHGIGLSPDATRIYLPAGVGQPISAIGFVPPAGGVKFGNGVTVIDAKTLKTVQSIETLDAPHHIQVLNDKYVMSDAWGTKQVLFALDPADGNKMTNQIAAAPFGGAPYIGFPSPDGKYIYMTVRPPKDAPDRDAWISRVNLSDWSVEKIVNVGPGAVWTTFSRDGRFAYVTIGEEDWVKKVDLAQKKVIGKASSGRGPYGAVLSPDENTLYVVSKGEGGHGQRGGTFVQIDAEAMRLVEERPSCLAYVCQADHAVLSPDGAELWIDNNMGYLDVFDIKTMGMKAEITMPLLADPHGGVFVQYDQSGKGHVVMDTGGPHGGVSPYVFDNQNGVPTLADALAKGWAPAKSSAALVLGATPPTPAPSAAAATTLELTMEDFRFEPTELTVAGGSQVTFQITNNGQAVHNFTSNDLGFQQFDVNINSTSEVTRTVPAKPGTYKFVCTYHPSMEGTITVK